MSKKVSIALQIKQNYHQPSGYTTPKKPFRQKNMTKAKSAVSFLPENMYGYSCFIVWSFTLQNIKYIQGLAQINVFSN